MKWKSVTMSREVVRDLIASVIEMHEEYLHDHEFSEERAKQAAIQEFMEGFDETAQLVWQGELILENEKYHTCDVSDVWGLLPDGRKMASRKI